MAEAGSSDCEIQKKQFSELNDISLKKGDTWYLIDTKWLKQWKKYVGYDQWNTSVVGEKSAYPGPIDLSNLLDDQKELKSNLLDELDYQLVSEAAWNKLVDWYGVSDDQEPIARKVIEQGMFTKQTKVEVYLVGLKLCEHSKLDEQVVKPFSKTATIEDIERAMRDLFHINENKEVRLWNRYMSNTFEALKAKENTLQDAGLHQGQVIVIEQKNDDGSWPRQTKTSSSHASGSSYSSYSSSGKSSYYNSSYDGGHRRSPPGICGLSNLGNTCFMNSALQCMSNVPMLTNFMLRDRWKEDLNYDNPLGMHGEIASSYAELVKSMWSGQLSYTVPRAFKVAVGRFAPQFSGYQQQDSQELMAFLLDGLHEDLNRIRKKPYVEQKDGGDRPDAEVAREAWDNYKLRNDSVIVDTFHGLLKSTLVCPECSKVSVTFDPFCYLSLPLPVMKERQIDVFLIYDDPSKKAKQFKVTVPKMGCVTDLCRSLARLSGVDAAHMLVTDVYNHRFHKVFSPDESLSHILDRDDIFVYEVPVTSPEDPNTVVVPVYLRERRIREAYNNYRHVTSTLFGQPLLVAAPRRDLTYEGLYSLLLQRMARYVRPPRAGEVWWTARDQEELEPEDDEDATEEADGASGPSGEGDTRMQGMDTGECEADCAQDANVPPRKAPRLFNIQVVNSYGSAEVDKMLDDGRPLKLTSRTYLAIDWSMRARDQFYDDRAAEALDTDESMQTLLVQKKQAVQLGDCLDLFTKQEKLGENDPWYCPQCKKHQRATKKFDLWQLPGVLVVHLKRFSYNRYWRDKLDTLVEYPTKRLNMRKYVINTDHGPADYDLIGVVNHYGGMGGGHYTAYCKNFEDGDWYHFDDSSVSGTREDSVVTRAGYVLVYQRRDTVEPRTRTVPSAANGAAVNGVDSDDDMDVN